ncbi:SDR family oxidoreductase [Sphingomonas desiccabilis]|uniref:SDR family oxidoreductase n=1 Tax=Sphingomonas desiccabilis TaxID=429134 RepID=A0A4Q2IQK4_9SPHN|nr:SDR family NAD(P)-dependent oxidoreductase [Sphingomonas desiccabilis]MBB3911148.1 NAD(P)-dependent dehydrogenase (short-subunit alcohol dehydrogenase family) [Sphingomonas desiccabilis]RXZ32046.1 SDR family oxidoreductase [Sphingomonas desiccabilis]
MRFSGQVALVTGAGSGIGKAVALRLAGEGCAVGVLTHTAEDAERVSRQIADAGGRALPLVADVSREDQVKAAVADLVRAYGRLDHVFANAGINGVWAPIDELGPDEWDRTINTNLRGTYLTLHYAVPHLKRAGAGAIVITASVNGTRIFSNAGATAYSCTKAAQVAMTQMLALELAKFRIRVNAICPGKIGTNIEDSTTHRDAAVAGEPVEYPEGKIPLTDGEPGTSDEVADLVLFLLSDQARHISGTPVWIDGAESLLVG